MSLAYLFDSNIQFQDKSGNNNVNGFLRVYIDNTDDRAVTYKDFNGTLNQADIRLDNNGRAVVIVDDSKTYRLEVYGTTGVLLWTLYPISPKATGINETLEALVAAVKSNTIAIEGLALAKKNKQQAKVISGTPTQTVKSLSQNADGEITVEFDDIDFPYNIKINSPDDSIEVGTPVVDQERKEETIPISVKRPGLVKADPADTEPGTLIDKLEIEDTVQEPEDQTLLEVVPTDGKVAINEDRLRETINGINNSIDGIVETIDEMDVDSVPHAYLHSTLAQSAGDSVTTSTPVNVFAQDALEGDCFEFEQTTTIDDTPFGYVWIEPGTYLINASVTLQWVGNPRGTFVAKVGSVMGENFDFSQEQEIKRNTTKVVTIPNRMKLAINITYDAGTPVMGFWIQSMQVVKLAGGMSQTNITHDDTLVGQGSLSHPIGVDTKAVAQSTLVDNLAPAFDPTRTEENPYIAYKDICVYEGGLYKCITTHYGPWVAAHFDRTSGDTLFAKTRDVIALENDKVDKSISRCGNDYYRVIKSSGVVAEIAKNGDLTFVWTFTKGDSGYSASTIRLAPSSTFLANKYRFIFENLGSEISNVDILLANSNGEWSNALAIGRITISANEQNFLNIVYDESYRSRIESFTDVNLTLRVEGEGNVDEKTLKFCVEKVEEKYFADVQTSNYSKDSSLLGGKSPDYYAKADDVVDKEYIDESISSIASQEFCQSIDPLTDKNLFSENEQTQSGIVAVRSWNDSLKPYTFSVNASKMYYVVVDVLLKNNSGTTIGHFFLNSSGFDIRKSSGEILERASFYAESSKRWISSTISGFSTNIENGGEAIFRMLLKFDPSSYDSTTLYWTVSLDRFAENSGSSTFITSGVSVKGINSWVFADDGQDPEELLKLTGKLIQSESFIVKESLISETTKKILSKFNNKKLVTYGDSITANGGWQDYIRKYLNLNSVVNKGIGGTFVCQKNGSSSAFCSLSRIETVDSDADAVIIMGGTNDAGQGYEIGDLTYNNGFDVTKFKGALATTVRLMQSQCPNADIFIASPLGGRGTTGEVSDMPVYVNGLTTYDYAKACREVAEFFCIPYIPIFEECFINSWNRTKYIADGVHPNDAGKKRIAEVMIKSLCLWQNVEP